MTLQWAWQPLLHVVKYTKTFFCYQQKHRLHRLKCAQGLKILWRMLFSIKCKAASWGKKPGFYGFDLLRWGISHFNILIYNLTTGHSVHHHQELPSIKSIESSLSLFMLCCLFSCFARRDAHDEHSRVRIWSGTLPQPKIAPIVLFIEAHTVVATRPRFESCKSKFCFHVTKLMPSFFLWLNSSSGASDVGLITVNILFSSDNTVSQQSAIVTKYNL